MTIVELLLRAYYPTAGYKLKHVVADGEQIGCANYAAMLCALMGTNPTSPVLRVGPRRIPLALVRGRKVSADDGYPTLILQPSACLVCVCFKVSLFHIAKRTGRF